MSTTDAIARVHRALEALAAGKLIILVDDEDRENEGDLVMAADLVTPEAINFMAAQGRGLVCLTLEEARVRQLGLSMMASPNEESQRTAFTVSIEAREGVTTGISAADRAHTIRTAVAADAKPSDLVSPGHVFPLKARRGGVLQRSGHTEGSVDLVRLAGRTPAAVICEIMNDDGTMARRDDLRRFAEKHDLALVSIADLIQFRLNAERLVRRIREGELTFESGRTWKTVLYDTPVEDRQYLALVLGAIESTPALVRVHTASVLGDVFDVPVPSRVSLRQVVSHMEELGRGVILLIPSRRSLEQELAWLEQRERAGQVSEPGDVVRELGLGSQILADLGLRQIRLVTSRPWRLAALDAYGLEVVEQVVFAPASSDTGTNDRTIERALSAVLGRIGQA